MALNRRNGKGSNQKKPPLSVIQGTFGGDKLKNSNTEDTIATFERIKKEKLKEYKVKITKEKLKNLSAETVAQTIIDCDGYIMKTAIKLNCSYGRIVKIIKANPKLKDLIKDSSEALLDLSENQLRDLILAGDRSAIIFHLKCKGRHRGWIEDGPPINEDEQPVQFSYQTVLPVGFKIVPEDAIIIDPAAKKTLEEKTVEETENKKAENL
jgi:hypothetical protein